MEIDSFIEIILAAEVQLRSKIKASRKFIIIAKDQIRKARSEVEELKEKETYNQYGIMDNSNLVVKVIKVSGLAKVVVGQSSPQNHENSNPDLSLANSQDLLTQ